MTGTAAGEGPAGPDDEATRVVPAGSEEVTRDLRKPGRAAAAADGGEERTRDLRRSVLRRFGPPSVPGRLRPGGPPSSRPRRPPEPDVERDEFGLPRARFTPPVPLPPPAPAPGRPGTALIAVGVVVGVLFLAVAGLGLWVILGAGSGGDAAELATGDCVSVTGAGTESGPAVEPAECGSEPANYRVVGVGSTTATCPGDVDNAFTRVSDGADPVAVCLDIDWAEGDCFELVPSPLRVDCAAPPGGRTVRVAETLRGTVDAAECSTGAGLPYEVRRFIVCAREL